MICSLYWETTLKSDCKLTEGRLPCPYRHCPFFLQRWIGFSEWRCGLILKMDGGICWVREIGTHLIIFYFSFVLTIFIRQQTSEDSSKRHWTLNDLLWIVTEIELSIGAEYALLLRPHNSFNLLSTSLVGGGWIIWNPSVSGINISLRPMTFVHESVSDICNNNKFT